MLVKGAPGEKTSPGCIPQNKQRCQAICPSLTSGYPAFPLSLYPRHHYHSNPITRPSWAQRAAFWQLDGTLLAIGESQSSLRISGIGFHRKWCNKWFCWRNALSFLGVSALSAFFLILLIPICPQCQTNPSVPLPVWYKTKFGSQNLATKFGNHLCVATKIGSQC